MKIAIRGHELRGKEVIQILESLGGINECLLDGSAILYYYIDYYDDKTIHCHDDIYVNKYCEKYTLEEFEKEFPFKIGDKVTIVGLPDFPKIITKMAWDCDEILYSFEGLNNTWFGTKALKKFKMKEGRNITLTIDKAKEWYNKGGELKEVALQAYSEEELNSLPRSWEEFCKRYSKTEKEAYIGVMSAIYSFTGTKRDRDKYTDKNICPSKKSAEAHLAMIQLEQLRNCWRNGWEPDWNDDQQPKYCVTYYHGEFKIRALYEARCFLSFPTREMAEEFLECFRDLIEKAGDLI